MSDLIGLDAYLTREPRDDGPDPDMCGPCQRGDCRDCEGDEERECSCGSHVHQRNVAAPPQITTEPDIAF